jgi:large subunit ribosomal protein L6
MRKNIEKTIVIPEGVNAILEGTKLTVKKDGKEAERDFGFPKIKLEKDKDIKLSAEKATKRELQFLGTAVAHIKNMLRGLDNDFVYQMEVCNVHFPMTVKVEGDKLKIKNFLGEKVDRFASILPNVKVEVKDNLITLSSSDKAACGQTAGNIEKATKVKGRDKRIFQDGIYITEKPIIDAEEEKNE